MRALREIRGLKYPDEFVVRHFFKRGLHLRTGRVAELGCGTGNNLGLYLAHGWTTLGIDYDQGALDDARWNLGSEAELLRADLADGAPPLVGGVDALLLPNVLCYLTLAQAENLLHGVRAALPGPCEVFVRTRLVSDYRFGRGDEVEPDTYRLYTDETGEAGLINRFYTESALVALLNETLGLVQTQALRVCFDNLQGGKLVPNNSDLVVWGQVGGR